MTTFAYWKRHNNLPEVVTPGRACSGSTVMTPHAYSSSYVSRSASAARPPIVPRALFMATASTPDVRIPSASPTLSVQPPSLTSASVKGSRVLPSPTAVVARPESSPPARGASQNEGTKPPADRSSAASVREERVRRTPSHHRPASAVTPGIRSYYNHLQPINPDARRWLDEYKTMARPARLASFPRTPTPTQPPAQSPQHLGFAHPRASLSTSASTTTPSGHSPTQWTESQKPLPPSPLAGHRRASQNIFFADVPTQPEQAAVVDGAGAGRRRSSEASFTEQEVVRVRLEQVPHNVDSDQSRGPAELAIQRPHSTWLSVTCSPSRPVPLVEREDAVTATVRMEPMDHAAPFRAHTQSTEPPLTRTPDEELREASLHAQNTPFREGEDGRPVTALPLAHRRSPVAHTTRSLNGEGLSGAPESANIPTATTGGAWRPTIVARVGETLVQPVAPHPPSSSLPQTLGDYDWIRTAQIRPNTAISGSEVESTTRATTAMTNGTATDGSVDESLFPMSVGLDNATRQKIAGLGDDENGDLDDDDDDAMEEMEPNARVVVDSQTSDVPIVLSSARLSHHRTLASVTANATSAHRGSAEGFGLVVATPHRGARAGRSIASPLSSSENQQIDADVNAHDTRVFCAVVRDKAHDINESVEDASPPPRLPESGDEAMRTDTPTPSEPAKTSGEAEGTDAANAAEAVRECFADLLPGLTPRSCSSRHSLDLQKDRLARAVPAMCVTSSGHSAHAAPSSPLCQTSAVEVDTHAAATPDANALSVGSVAFASPLAGEMRSVSGLIYPSSNASTPGASTEALGRPMNPRLSQQSDTSNSGVARVIAVGELGETSVTGSHATTCVGTGGPQGCRSRALSAKVNARSSVRGDSARAPQKDDGVSNYLASQLRQAIRDASLMRLDDPARTETDDAAPLSVTSHH